MPTHPVEHAKLIPWDVRPQHRNNFHLSMLRVAARIRAGELDSIRPVELDHHTSWRCELSELNAVVLYDPHTPDGFYLVPRRKGDDDIIRRPS